jgi:hypothetical protein
MDSVKHLALENKAVAFVTDGSRNVGHWHDLDERTLLQNKFVKLRANTKNQKSNSEYLILKITSANSLIEQTSPKGILKFDFLLSESLLK